jgi:hypothetical protein
MFLRIDWRLSFYNLKSTGNLENNVGIEEEDAIWIPSLLFDNSVEERHVVNDEFSSIAIYQETQGFKILNEFLQENIEYKGSENYLIFSRTYKMDLVCEFEQHNFPFDTQTCSIKVG